MKKSVFSIVLIVFVSFVSYISAQGVYYYELANGNGDGHYIQINPKACYDSDKNGISLSNGLRRRQADVNEEKVYYGDSQFGFAYYYFSDDYQKLRIEIEKDGTTYYYRSTTPTTNAVSAHTSKPRSQGTITTSNYPVVTSPQPDLYSTNPSATTSSSSSQGRICPGCGGTGFCTMCNGRGIYKNIYTSNYDRCPSCNGSGQCKVCHGHRVIK